MKINAGKYGRTNKGRILVFSWLQDGNGKTMKNCVVKYVNGGVIKYWLDEDEKIVKHSKNIIDLIEVGDIVKTGEDTIFANVMETQENLDYFKELYKNDIDAIRAIITKEQIEEMEYRV